MNVVSFWLLPIFGFINLADTKMFFKPPAHGVPFMVHYKSTYRALCHGAMVSRQVVLTAAVCVIPLAYLGVEGANLLPKAINVVVGTKYRHPRRGIKIQVTKILYPKAILGESQVAQMVRVESSMVLFLLKRKVSDLLTEVPVRSIFVDHTGQAEMYSHSTCLTAGWHYFGPWDKVMEPGIRFRLYRNLRVQVMDIVKPDSKFCEPLIMKYQLIARSIYGYTEELDQTSMICVRDGMVGSPLICDGKVVALFTMFNGQWSNCSGYSAIYHLVNNQYMKKFMECVSILYEPTMMVNMNRIHKSINDQLYEVEQYNEPGDTYDQFSTKDPLSDQSDEDVLEKLPHAVPGK